MWGYVYLHLGVYVSIYMCLGVCVSVYRCHRGGVPTEDYPHVTSPHRCREGFRAQRETERDTREWVSTRMYKV